ncbi:hypothetical protein [Rhodococcus aetherivorans]|nr:hypothetical protein [Rhodococcus aetherivorans]CCW14637.1 hypothetical protein EBESD8_52070 [Rhodococcus aetherivorans]
MTGRQLAVFALAVGVSAAGVAVSIFLAGDSIVGAIEKSFPQRWKALP